MKKLITNSSSGKKTKFSMRLLVKFCFGMAILVWGISLLWVSRHANNFQQDEEYDHNIVLGVPTIHYHIPESLVPSHPVRVLARDPSQEQIKTPDGRSTLLSTEAFREFGEDLRTLMQQGRESLLSRGNVEATIGFRQHLHARAPWLKGDPSDPAWPYNTIPKPIDGKAIIICAGDPQLPYLKNLIYSLRVDHDSSMPIKIIFLDDQDLTTPSQEIVTNIIPPDKPKNLEFVNLSKYFNLKQVHLKGWDLKAYGLLAVPENEVMFLDVDVMLLQSPETMFEQNGYQESGALFFHDRMFMRYIDFLYDPGTFAMALQPNLSDPAKRAIHNGDTPYNSEHVQESGMLLLDKTRSIVGLWAVCLIYGREDVRRYAQAYHMYGDKEMYWISFETVGEKYTWAKFYPGAIGGVATDFEFNNIAMVPTDAGPDVGRKLEYANNNHFGLCGRLVHFDEMGQPLWVNGGYLTKEEEWQSTSAVGSYPLNPLWFVDGGDWTTEDFIPEYTAGPFEKIWSFFAPNPRLEDYLGHWEHVKDSIPMNQNWRVHERIGVYCLMANTRGIQLVPPAAYELGSEAVKRFFLEELQKGHKYDNYFQ
ncbi:Mannosyltransferase putative [Seminavis robusta]|uniref:Mannosyltransferase putative n=1 Tax=Seminavis robusta TaxID=568900 RepID=A0A9N8DEJ9_9STRA|nr:Mannosyltransferase putative [Seminavis robusta]|eukprot:Sro58_g033580.1 Mannosyltransferase putative (590) ;mRNA; f:16433-18301